MKFAINSSSGAPAQFGRAAICLALLLCSAVAQAQIYKWVDANGKTHFSDKPPPASAKQASTTIASTVGISTVDMPYALAMAARNYPVTLWTTSPCGGCDSGRSFLKSRGIPFSEKTVRTARDEALLKAEGGDNLPLLVVGRSKATGYLESEWDQLLSAARYPARMLPKSYRHPEPVAAAPAEPKAPDREAIRLARAEAAALAEKNRRQAEADRAARTPPAFQF